MSQENVELAKTLLPQPGTDVVLLIRDEDTFARMAQAALAHSLRTTSRASWLGQL